MRDQRSAPSAGERTGGAYIERFFENRIDFHVMRAEGAYELIEKVGTGSTSDIYLARFAESPGSSFAVKIVRPDLAEGTGYVEALEREAAAAIQFTHSCACKIFNIERASDGGALIAMEYIKGVTLFELIRRVKMQDLELPREIPLWIIAEAARALYAAHKTPWAEGEKIPILHAAISPLSMMISREGEVKILGIGVGRSELCLPPSQMTTSYRAPELIERTGTDRRADIYSLGMVLSRMMPSLLEGRDDTSTVLRSMLSKKRGERPQSLSQVLAVIEPQVADDAAICTSLAQLVRRLFPAEVSERREIDELVVPNPVTPLPEIEMELPIEEPAVEEPGEIEQGQSVPVAVRSSSNREVEAIELPDMTFEEEDSGMTIAPAFEFLGDAQAAQALAAASQPMFADDLIDDVLRMSTGEIDLSELSAPAEEILPEKPPIPRMESSGLKAFPPPETRAQPPSDISQIALELYAKLAEGGSKTK